MCPTRQSPAQPLFLFRRLLFFGRRGRRLAPTIFLLLLCQIHTLLYFFLGFGLGFGGFGGGLRPFSTLPFLTDPVNGPRCRSEELLLYINSLSYAYMNTYKLRIAQEKQVSYPDNEKTAGKPIRFGHKEIPPIAPLYIRFRLVRSVFSHLFARFIFCPISSAAVLEVGTADGDPLRYLLCLPARHYLLVAVQRIHVCTYDLLFCKCVSPY